MITKRRALLSALILNVALSGLAGEPELMLPDPGSLPDNGQLALAMWGVVGGRLIDQDDCEVHVVERPELTSESVFAAGQWFQPATGRHNIWIQCSNLISPPMSVFSYAGEDATRGMRTVYPLVDAGSIVIEPPKDCPPEGQLRVLACKLAPTVFERRATLAQGRTGLAVPVGEVFGGVFDSSGMALAISKPVSVQRSFSTYSMILRLRLLFQSTDDDAPGAIAEPPTLDRGNPPHSGSAACENGHPWRLTDLRSSSVILSFSKSK